MKQFIVLIILCINLNVMAQSTPKVVLKDSTQLKLSSLIVDVNIIGNFATITYDMKFYNELNRTLEGELSFPLGEGQSVSNFAMDVNGTLREAVIVEKELARVAYENTVRQNIDPGLLEKTEGNNYKARVYPILPKKNKQIVITYEQDLQTVNDFMKFELPLQISEKLDEFTINFNVNGSNSAPIFLKNPYDKMFFNDMNDGFKASINKKNHKPLKQIVLKIPANTLNDQVLSFNDYFYAYKTLKPNKRLKSKPKSIAIVWDASYSLKNRNISEEVKLLDGYFEYLQNVEVEFLSFSNAIIEHKKLTIKNGNWHQLKQLINDIVYDGGTNLNVLSRLEIEANETLLFSDGLDNLGEILSNNKKPVYTINSMVSANHEKLNKLATVSGGAYINLLRSDHKEALKQLKQETFQFLGVKHDKSITEIYPSRNTNVTTDFSIAGRFSENTTIELLFGYSGKVTQSINVSVKKTQQKHLVKRLWAKQKLKALNFNKKENKKEIINLATQNHLITDYTSMLILDRLDDYVKYRIEPPQELKKEYKERIKILDEDEVYQQGITNSRKSDLQKDYLEVNTWYNSKFPKKEKKLVKRATPQTTNPIVNTTETDTIPIPTNANNQIPIPDVANAISNLDPDKRIIIGTVVDETNMPLPGATVVIKRTTTGTSTDFDGKFAINSEENDVLVISYVGYSDNSYKIDASTNNINVSLEPDNSLEEVVVTALGIKREPVTLGYAVSGKVAGVDIRGAVGATSNVAIRGLSTISNNGPLYIIDGAISNMNPIDSIPSDDIESMQVLSPKDGATLYGIKGRNGVIIVVTKEGKEKNKEAIENVNKNITDKIELKVWSPDTPYLKILEKEKTVESAYKKYLEIRSTYANIPAFYLDVADFFDNRKSKTTAIRVLTNLIEIDLNNYELIKALAYKLEYFKQYELATRAYEKVLKLRPEDPQSYRDLALSYESIGEYQKSFDLLYKIYNGELLEKDENGLFRGIEAVTYVELSRLVNKYKKKINLNRKQRKLLKPLPVNIRVVIDWNHKETDIDLWVIDPSGEKCLYSNSETKIGGRISEDLTDGFGPEEFMLKKAIKGRYKVIVDYYADNVQKISGPTILKVTMFTNYGNSNEEKKTTTVRLDKDEEDIEVGSLIF